jgi:anti-anti-sigma regulatory factor
MFDIDLTRDAGRALLRIIGSVDDPDARTLLREAFAFVPPTDHLVLDLTSVDTFQSAPAAELYEIIKQRGATAESIVVSSHEAVSMSLVLHNIDRVSPIVPTVTSAVELLDRWSAGRGNPAASAAHADATAST